MSASPNTATFNAASLGSADVDRLMGRSEVLGVVGISSATLWRWTKSGRFPVPMKIGARKTAWPLSVVKAWIEAQSTKAYSVLARADQ
jgi:prophage regulatory protein